MPKKKKKKKKKKKTEMTCRRCLGHCFVGDMFSLHCNSQNREVEGNHKKKKKNIFRRKDGVNVYM